MLRKTLLFAILSVVAFAIAVQAAEVPALDPPGLLSPEGPACQADPAAQAFAVIGFDPVLKGHDPATCGRCLNCSSTTSCFGKLFGDPCIGPGGTPSTCQAFNGCALYNCCQCTNSGG